MGTDGERGDPRPRHWSQAAFYVCCTTVLTLAVGYIVVAGSAVAPATDTRGAAVGQSGILPIAQSVASRAAAYWRARLGTPRPLPQERAAPPGQPGGTRLLRAAEPQPPGPAAGTPPPAPSVAPAAPYPAAAVSDPLTGTAFAGMPQVGAIFSTSGGSTTGHFCTGSVIASPQGDLVVTAAHCVYDLSSGSYAHDIAFVPGYHDSQAPYGVWAPSAIVVDPEWIADSDPDYDYAFLVLPPNSAGRQIQAVVGGDTLGVDGAYSALTQVIGYPSTTEDPITCTNYTKQLSDTQLEFDCAAFPGGTSGGPFLRDVDPATGLGTVVGVIGGYETGGDTPDVSYSAYFGDAAAALYAKAESAG